MDFSVVLSDPTLLSVVQNGIMERSFHDALVPNNLFRGEAMRVKFAGGIGTTMTFTGAGLIATDGRPVNPGDEPTARSYGVEHWFATIRQYGGFIPTHMPSSVVAIADLFLRNAHQLGIEAGQTTDKKVRNAMYNSAMAGWTNTTASATSTNTIHVARLNGFTRARNTTTGNFDPVSAANPLSITLVDSATATANTVVGFTADTNPDGSGGGELGPGTLTLGTQVTSVAARSYVISSDRSNLVLAGGGNSIDDLGATDTITLSNVRSVVAQMRTSSVPVHPDGRYHGHLDPTSESELFGDTEIQRLNVALPDYFMYKDFVITDIMGVAFIRNPLCPTADTVNGASGTTVLGATAGTSGWDNTDDFGGELYTTGGTSPSSTSLAVHRALISGQGGCMEYYLPLDLLLTDAGITGKIAEPAITNNGIELNTDGIQFLIRAPLNLWQDQVPVTWKIIADWPVRTDALAIGSQRYKRFGTICHT